MCLMRRIMSNSHYYRLTRYVCQSALLNTLSDNFRLKKLKNGTKYNLNSNSKLEAFSNQTLVCVPLHVYRVFRPVLIYFEDLGDHLKITLLL